MHEEMFIEELKIRREVPLFRELFRAKDKSKAVKEFTF